MSSILHVRWLWTAASLLASAALSPLYADLRLPGGTVMAAWHTTNARCTPPHGYNFYMPLRVYDDPQFTAEINSVLDSNRADGAERVSIPIYWKDDPDATLCDNFYVDSSGALPAAFTTNFPLLMRALRDRGFVQVTLEMLPDGPFIAQCDSSRPQWCGSYTQWGSAHAALLQTNTNFIANVLQFAIDPANNAGLWVDMVLNPSSIEADRNCSNYLSGYCGSGQANLFGHTRWGLEAKYITMIWDALASRMFYDGTNWIPGKERIYGFETFYDFYRPQFHNIPTLYTVPEPGGITITGLYSQTTAGTPYVVAIGDYSEYGAAGAEANLTAVFNQLTQAGDQTGIMIVETYYNDYPSAQGYKAAIDAHPERFVWFLLQWPLQYPGTEVLPTRFDNYHAWGF